MAVHRDFGVKNGVFWENGHGKGLLGLKCVFLAVQNDFWVKNGVWGKWPCKGLWVKNGVLGRNGHAKGFRVKDGVWGKVAVEKNF